MNQRLEQNIFSYGIKCPVCGILFEESCPRHGITNVYCRNGHYIRGFEWCPFLVFQDSERDICVLSDISNYLQRIGKDSSKIDNEILTIKEGVQKMFRQQEERSRKILFKGA
jgi:hypothetical protein